MSSDDDDSKASWGEAYHFFYRQKPLYLKTLRKTKLCLWSLIQRLYNHQQCTFIIVALFGNNYGCFLYKKQILQYILSHILFSSWTPKFPSSDADMTQVQCNTGLNWNDRLVEWSHSILFEQHMLQKFFTSVHSKTSSTLL